MRREHRKDHGGAKERRSDPGTHGRQGIHADQGDQDADEEYVDHRPRTHCLGHPVEERSVAYAPRGAALRGEEQ